jgi:hypothetical protein
MTHMTNNELIDESVAILQTMNAEDCAAAIDELRNELERVKGIARDRLATIAALRSCQESLDECEASLSPAGNDGLYGAYLRGELD